MAKKPKTPYLIEKVAIVLARQNHVEGDTLTPKELLNNISCGYRVSKSDNVKSLFKELIEFGIVRREKQRFRILRSSKRSS